MDWKANFLGMSFVFLLTLRIQSEHIFGEHLSHKDFRKYAFAQVLNNNFIDDGYPIVSNAHTFLYAGRMLQFHLSPGIHPRSP